MARMPLQCVQGKRVRALGAEAVAAWAANYQEVVIDIGTGDGRFVRDLARRVPALAAIGVDACQENQRTNSRTAPPNALFVVADALALPRELHRLATGVTINFPWGSLLRGLLDGEPGLIDGIAAIGREGCRLAIRLNAGAVAEVDFTLEEGAGRVAAILFETRFAVRPPRELTAADLRAVPTTWAKRVAFGRDPRAVSISATLAASR